MIAESALRLLRGETGTKTPLQVAVDSGNIAQVQIEADRLGLSDIQYADLLIDATLASSIKAAERHGDHERVLSLKKSADRIKLAHRRASENPDKYR